MSKFKLLVLAFSLWSGAVVSQNVSGPTSIEMNTAYTYSFNNGSLYSSLQWSSNSASIVSTWSSGSTYYASVRWNAPGTFTLGVINTMNFQQIGSLSGIVATVPAPSSTYTITQECGSTTVTRNSNPPVSGLLWYWQTSSTGTSTALGSSASISRTAGGALFLRARWGTTGAWSANSQSVGTISVYTTTPGTPASATDGHRISNAAAGIPVSVATVSGASGYIWYAQSTGNTVAPGSPSTNSWTPNVAQTTSYYVAANNGPCVSAGRRVVTANLYPEPVISANNNSTITMGVPVTLSVSNHTYTTYKWRNENNNIVATTPTLQTTTAGTYKVEVTKGTSPSFTTATGITVSKDVNGQNENYIVATEVLVPNIQSLGAVDNLLVDQRTQTVQYFDGLGRLIETVSTQASPSKQDIVQPVTYDPYGREVKRYLPFTAGNTGRIHPINQIINSNGDYIGAAAAFYAAGSNNNVADDAMPYGQMTYDDSPLSRARKAYGPGSAWAPSSVSNPTGADKYTESLTLVNKHSTAASSTDEKVISWVINTTGIPARAAAVTGYVLTGGYYANNQLTIQVTKDENGNATRVYTNKNGQTVLQKTQIISGSTNLNSTTEWALTYYIYDEFGALRFVLQPKLVQTVHSNDTNVPTATTLDYFAFQYKYDARRRLIEKKLPGAKWIYMVYDKRDRLVLSQDGEQRLSNKWSVIKYDRLNRPVITAIYTHGSSVTQSAMAGLVSSTNFFETYNGVSATHGYTNTVFPTTNLSILTVNYYDDYAFKSMIGNPSSGFNFASAHLAGQESQNFGRGTAKRIEGQVTGTKVNVLETTTYLWTAAYFDDKLRPIQAISSNHKAGVDTLTSVYDFVKLLKTRSSHKNGTNRVVTGRTMEYDHRGRIVKLFHSINGEEILLSRTTYNELGQSTKKQMHSRDYAVSFAQVSDFTYNIRGWLERINDPAGSELNDLFSMQLHYTTSASPGSSTQFNGNVREMEWRSAGGDKQSYQFFYDAANRMTEAKYFNSIRTLENGRYNEKIEAPTGLNSGYDLNGNILKLFRYGKTNSSDWGLMDQLTYTYTGNQLTRVDDAIVTNANEGGFRESVKTTNEYGIYNQNGSITKDLNKGVNLINYNHLNLVKRVEKSATEYLIYTYDATGRKLTQQVFGPAAKTTDYMGEFVYENNALQYILHEEGRVVADQSVGAPHPWEYEYFLKDHLGNVRVTFSEKTTSTAYSATMENNTQAGEQSTFDGYLNGSRSSFHPFDHTDAGTTYTYSQLLNGGNNNQVGLAKSFEVKAGDVLDLEVYAKYEAPGTTTNNPNTLITALITAFGISSSGSTPLEGSQALDAFNSAYAPGPVIGRLEPYEDNVAPRAYLNYILFDENFALVDFGFDQISTGAQQVGVSPIVPHDYLNLHVKVKKKGYLYVYLSNEQAVQTNVYFDDLKIVHHTGVKNTSDYYPFGLTYNQFDAEGSKEQRYQFNGKELQDELDLTWLDYGARMYHGDIGRWSVVDPLAELAPGWTPYRYAFNNPVRYIDPDGRVEKDHRAKTVQSGNDDGKNDPMEISRKAYHKDGKFHVDINYRDFSPSTGAPGFGSLSGFFNEAKHNSGNQESYPLKLNGASFEQIVNAFRHAYERRKRGDSFFLDDIFDWNDASYDYGSWGQKQHEKVFPKVGASLLVVFDAISGVDGVTPYYPMVKESLSKGSGWEIDETKVPTGGKIGFYEFKEKFPYGMVIHGNDGTGQRLAILSFSNLKQFQAFKDYVRGTIQPTKIEKR